MVKGYNEKIPKNMNEVVALIKKRKPIFIGVAVVIALMLALLFVLQPERSVASFCKTLESERENLVGDVSYESKLGVYKKLEAVSPDDIRPDITMIRKGYEKIVSDPSTSLSAGLGIIGSESRRDKYIKESCPAFKF